VPDACATRHSSCLRAARTLTDEKC
jgi:hypothetical protein